MKPLLGIGREIARWAAVVLLVLFLVLWLPVGAVLWRAYDALPKTRGEIAAAGVQAPVSILRDANGVPHISAQNAHDANFAVGFVHAQDRLFQMAFTRWYLRGELASVLGGAAVQSDSQLRTYGLAAAADAVAAALTAEEIAPLQAYADGVNAAMASRGFRPPLEFLLLGVKPQPWTAADAALIYKGLALDLVSGEAFRAFGDQALETRLGPERMAEFLPPYPAAGPIALSAEELGLAGLPVPQGAPTSPPAPAPGAPDGGPVKGSNNWVVSGARTQSGLPLLANDPHLSLRAPGVWYLASVSTPEGTVTGATVAGAPAIVLGHNDRIAWGFTNTGTDLADLVIAPESAIISETVETIEVRFGEPVELRVRRTADGPVLHTDLFGQGWLAGPGEVAVLRWNLDDPEDRTVTVGAALNAAQDWPEFEAALQRFYTPMQNMVFASVDGDIGFLAPGNVPVRDTDGNWRGAAPFAELPRVLNPADGMIVTANNRITPPEYPHFLTAAWAEPYRARRITELLLQTEAHTARSFAAIQQDVRDLAAARIAPALARAQPQTEAGRAALRRIAGWNGDMAAGAAEPLIYAAWMKALSRAIYEDELGEDFGLFWGARTPFMESVLAGPNGHWCDVAATPETETCLALAGPALDRAAAGLRDAYGADIDGWRWGAAHQAYFPHAPFALFPVLDDIFSGRVAMPGDGVTVNVGHFEYGAPGFETQHAGGFRAVYDLADLGASLFAMPMGQSGHLASPHYRDLLEPWAAGDYFRIERGLTAETPGVMALTLTPPE